MYDPPGYLWAITIAGIIAIPAATCVVLYRGAVRAGLSRRLAITRDKRLSARVVRRWCPRTKAKSKPRKFA